MSISANTLFHFTRKYETLLSILKTKVYPRMHIEKCYVGRKQTRWAIPMACFCDIPLSYISQHMKTYGSYAIGLKKDKLMEQGTSPVLYVHNNTTFVKSVSKTLNWLIDNQTVIKDATSHSFEELPLYYMLKPYKGKEVDEKGKAHNVRYYDEREWRYIPSVGSNEVIFLTGVSCDDKDKMDEMNKKYEDYGVTFTPDDINYIIVDNESEILDLIQNIRVIKNKYPADKIDKLISKIITKESIMEDF